MGIGSLRRTKASGIRLQASGYALRISQSPSLAAQQDAGGCHSSFDRYRSDCIRLRPARPNAQIRGEYLQQHAEGDARQTDKESVQFFFVAKGSLAELSAQIEIAAEIHALPKDEVQCLLRECDEIGAMLQALIDHRRK